MLVTTSQAARRRWKSSTSSLPQTRHVVFIEIIPISRVCYRYLQYVYFLLLIVNLTKNENRYRKTDRLLNERKKAASINTSEHLSTKNWWGTVLTSCTRIKFVQNDFPRTCLKHFRDRRGTDKCVMGSKYLSYTIGTKSIQKFPFLNCRSL